MASSFYFVKVNITRLLPAELIDRARALIAALTGNAGFPTPAPTLVELGDAADALEAADAAVINNGGRQDYLARNKRAQELRDLIILLGSYVQVASGGDPEKILSAGFEIRRTPSPAGLLPAPGNLRAVASSLPGVMDLRWDRVRHRLIYQVEFCTGDPLTESWKPLVLLGNNTYSASGLASGTAYSFRLRAIGAAGPGPLSDTATGKPQ